MKFVATTRKIGKTSLSIIIPYEIVQKFKIRERKIYDFEIFTQ